MSDVGELIRGEKHRVQFLDGWRHFANNVTYASFGNERVTTCVECLQTTNAPPQDRGSRQ